MDHSWFELCCNGEQDWIASSHWTANLENDSELRLGMGNGAILGICLGVWALRKRVYGWGLFMFFSF
jgi:hypothetical protein